KQRVGGSAFASLPEVIRSPYLLGVGAWVSLLSFGATILYFEQANIVAETVHGAGAQTRIFASIDLAVGLLTLATPVLGTGRLLKRFGTGLTSGALPAVYIVGFAALAMAPALSVVIVVQVVQRWMNFAVANPVRQVFFTVVSREEKYKAKNLIDVVIYRGSDALYGWVFDSLQALGLKLGTIALSALPVAVGWLILSVALGQTHERHAGRRPTGPAQGGGQGPASPAATLPRSRPPRCWRDQPSRKPTRHHSSLAPSRARASACRRLASARRSVCSSATTSQPGVPQRKSCRLWSTVVASSSTLRRPMAMPRGCLAT